MAKIKQETFYKISKGQRVKMTNSEVKAAIMRANKWTNDEYRKQYYIIRNKLRAFEAYERASGKQVEGQSVQALLFKEARARKRMGEKYKPSIKMQRIRSFTSVSSGQAGQKALQGTRYKEARGRLYEDATFRQFQRLIETNAQAQYIYDTIQDPVKREQALAAFADELHTKIDEFGKAEENEAIPFGETFGSADTIDFDISDYL